jgi:acetylornithine/N-succinyldiaminopimelate aminotransferase
MLSRVYDALPLKVERAHGVRISTDKGEFLDTFAGIGVLAFGHTDEKTIEAIKKRSEDSLTLPTIFSMKMPYHLAKCCLI